MEMQERSGPAGPPGAAVRHAGLRLVVSVLRALLGGALLVWVLSRSGLRALEPVLSSPWVLLVLLGLSVFGATVEAERLRLLFRSAGLSLDRRLAYRVVPVGTFFNFSVPGGTGGDVVKLYYLAKENRGRGVEVVTVVLVDRIVALASILVIVLLLALSNIGLVRSSAVLRSVVLATGIAVAGIGVVVALAWSRRLRASRLYGWLMHRIPFRSYVARVADAVHSFRERRRALLGTALIAVTGHLGVAAAYVAVATVILPSIQWPVVAFLSLLGMVANALPLTPGGLGVGEAAFEQLFRIAGTAGGAALLVLWRVSMIPLAALGAALYMAGRVGTGRTPMDTATATAEEAAAHDGAPAERTA